MKLSNVTDDKLAASMTEGQNQYSLVQKAKEIFDALNDIYKYIETLPAELMEPEGNDVEFVRTVQVYFVKEEINEILKKYGIKL